MKLIETKTLGTATSAIIFTSIPQDGTDLLAVCSLRDTSGASGYSEAFVKPNSSSSGFSERQLYGNGSTAASYSATDGIRVWVTGNGNPTANTFASCQVYIPNYTSSSNKSISVESVTEGNNVGQGQFIGAGLWSNTNAINSLEFDATGTNNFVVGSTISLYKITKGTDGTTVVS